MVKIWNKHKQINTTLKPKVFVALSGGVDSSVAAALLKESGFDVTGVHIKMWSDPSIPCTTKEDRLDAMRVAASLNIPFETWDFTQDYKRSVVDYMIREYSRGLTPNPDVMCNKEIKFGIFLKTALQRGADFVATGHYVRLRRHNTNLQMNSNATNTIRGIREKFASFALYSARDAQKDQSYFLWTLTPEQLKRCIFPIGDYTKPEVRVLARKYKLPTAEKKDSQGLCFMGKIDVREFLKTYIPERRGLVVTASGKKIGEHGGLEFYTLGQRRGISIGGGTPYYVAEKDFATNTLVVADGKNDPRLNRNSLIAEELSWTSGAAPDLPIRSEARIRYRHELQPCRLEKVSENGVKVLFDTPEHAITPGQSIVFYKGERLLGGGIIQ